MARYILDKEGYVKIKYVPRPTPTEGALMSMVCYQQINTRLAIRLQSRLFEHLSMGAVLTVEGLRKDGFSQRKAETVLRIKEFFDETLDTANQYVPELYTSEEAIKLFTQIKGIGDWTAKAYLLFTEGRPDIVLHEDLDVRKGLALQLGLSKVPTPKESISIIQRMQWPTSERSMLSKVYLELGKLRRT